MTSSSTLEQSLAVTLVVEPRAGDEFISSNHGYKYVYRYKPNCIFSPIYFSIIKKQPKWYQRNSVPAYLYYIPHCQSVFCCVYVVPLSRNMSDILGQHSLAAGIQKYITHRVLHSDCCVSYK